MKKTLITLLSLFLIFSLASCTRTADTPPENEKAEYSLTVSTEGGMPLTNLTVQVYSDETKTQPLSAGITDKNGLFGFTASESDKYVAVINGFKAGFIPESEYRLTKGNNEIVVKSKLVEKRNGLVLGDIAFDFELTDVNGTVHKASEILTNKKALVINLWFENCGPCAMEFPYMQQAYEQYKEKLEILAINPCDGTNTSIKQYAVQKSLTFPMAKVNDEWALAFDGLYGYPTTVIIDRYGMVAMMHTGAITDKDTFVKMFEYFTSDNYVQKTIRGLGDIK